MTDYHLNDVGNSAKSDEILKKTLRSPQQDNSRIPGRPTKRPPPAQPVFPGTNIIIPGYEDGARSSIFSIEKSENTVTMQPHMLSTKSCEKQQLLDQRGKKATRNSMLSEELQSPLRCSKPKSTSRRKKTVKEDSCCCCVCWANICYELCTQ